MGGVGIDISTLRPENTKVTNAAGTSTGAISFMERFSNSTREVAQNGRRGALMISIDIRHPDVENFINIKKDLTKVTGANISVMVRDDFMEAVKADRDYILRWPCNEEFFKEGVEKHDYNKLYPYFKVNINDNVEDKPIGYFKKVKAREIWNKLIEAAHGSAEPGILFIDKHWNYSPDTVYPKYKGVTTNP